MVVGRPAAYQVIGGSGSIDRTALDILAADMWPELIGSLENSSARVTQSSHNGAVRVGRLACLFHLNRNGIDSTIELPYSLVEPTRTRAIRFRGLLSGG
jgi:hypothetical protein